MESHWARNRPAYRCRHGHSSAVARDQSRAPNAYVREDQILPHLPALIIRMTTVKDHKLHPLSRTPLSPEDAAARLRAEAVSLTYDPAGTTLTANTPNEEKIIIG